MYIITTTTPKETISEPFALEAAIEIFVYYAAFHGLKCDNERQIREWITRDGIYSVNNGEISITLKS